MISLPRRSSIRVQLLLLALAVALPVAGILAYYIVDEAQQAREAAHARLEIVADSTAEHLNRMLREHHSVLARLAARPQVRALDPRNCDPVIADYVSLHPEFTTLAVRDLRGQAICSFNPAPPPSERVVALAWFQEGLRSGAFSVGDAYLGQSSGRWLSVLTYPIRNEQDELTGLIAFALDLAKLNQRIFQQVSVDTDRMVLDRDGRILLRSADAEAWIGKPLPRIPTESIHGKNTELFSMRDLNGVLRLHAVAVVPGTGWRVFAGQPEDEVYADYRGRLHRAIGVGLAVLLLVPVFAWRIGSAVSGPVAELARTATKIAGGDIAARARPSGPQEIEHVAQQFNRMLDALQRQREERAALVGRIEELFRQARDIILLIDPSGNIVEANAAAVAAYGYSLDELLRLNIRDLRSEMTQAAIERDWQGAAGPLGVLFETEHRRKDGSTFPVEVSAQTIDVEGVRYRQSFIRDISERRAAHAQIRRLNRVYAMLSETNKVIVRLQDLNELFSSICRIAVELGGYVCAWVGRVDETNHLVVPVEVQGEIAEYARQIRISTDPEQPEGRGPTALALREGRPYYCQDFRSDPATEPWRKLGISFGIGSTAALPLRRGGVVIGVLNLYSAAPRAFDAPMQALLEEMAADVSFALDNFEREAARRKAEAAMAQSEARYRGIIETAHDAFILIGDNGELLDTNEATAALTGYSREQLLKMRLSDLEALETVEEIARTTGEVMQAGHKRFERAWRHRDGRLINIEISSTYMGKEQGGHFFSFIHDITERKQSEQALREGEQRFRSMLEQNVSAMFMVEEGKLSYVNLRAAQILGFAADELTGRTMLELVVEPDRPAIAEAMRQLQSGERNTVEHTFGALRKDGSVADLGWHAILATVRGKRAILGMAQDIGERKKAQAEIDRHIVRLEQAMESTLQAVSGMVELRDPYTAGHERRVGGLAAAIGAEMGLPEATVKALRLAGYVHDIGKINVPAEILAKPSRLTPMEFELIKGHSQSGYDVLRRVDFPWPIAEIILQHHERLDGSGYPRQLKGDEIILEARVIAVADVVEAMSSHRPYRPGFGLDAALEEIARDGGKIYDAEVAAACLRLFREKGYVPPV